MRRTFPLADVNGDGRVSFAEFKQFIQLKAWNTHLEMAVEDLVEQVAQQVDESLQESTLQTIEDSLQESLDVSQSLLDDELENTSDQPPPLATLPGTVLRNGELWPDRPAYYVRLQEQWVATSWAEYARLVRQTARAMLQLGVERGRTVCMLGDNRPEWTIFDVAAMAIGAVPAGIYTTNSPVECSYIINHSEATVVLVENLRQWNKIKSEWDGGRLPALKHVIMMTGTPDDTRVQAWEQFLALGDFVKAELVDESIAQVLTANHQTVIGACKAYFSLVIEARSSTRASVSLALTFSWTKMQLQPWSTARGPLAHPRGFCFPITTSHGRPRSWPIWAK